MYLKTKRGQAGPFACPLFFSFCPRPAAPVAQAVLVLVEVRQCEKQCHDLLHEMRYPDHQRLPQQPESKQLHDQEQRRAESFRVPKSDVSAVTVSSDN